MTLTARHNTKSVLSVQGLVDTSRQTSQSALSAGTNITDCRKIPLILKVKEPVHGQVCVYLASKLIGHAVAR